MLFLVCVPTLKKKAALALHVKNQRLQGTTKHSSNLIKNLPQDFKFDTLIFPYHCQIVTAVVICLRALMLLFSQPLPRDAGMAEDHEAPEAEQLPRAWTRGRKKIDSRQRVSGAKSP